MHVRPAAAIAAVALTCAACVPGGQPSNEEAQSEQVQVTATETNVVTVTPVPEKTAAEERVPEDLRMRVASLMVVGAADYDQARAALEQGAGGLIIPSWADPKLLTEPGRNINALREEFDRPFTVAIDFEGGRVQRHSDVLGSFPAPRDLANQPPEVIRGTGYDIGVTLRKHGINVDYAPLLDLDVTDLDIVGDRAFGQTPERVSEVATLFSQGLVDAGVTPTFKHFPGHGRASGDTHLTLAVTPPIEELNASDLVPYGTVLPQFPTGSVMVGHMVVPGVGEPNTPSSLNPAAYRMLREGNYPGGKPFAGVAVTDDLSGMRAITDLMPTPEAVRRAIAAGADQALWSSGSDLGPAIDATVGAVERGEIPEERINAAAARVQQQFIDANL
ncbi:glycoside hydrolase family 3 protein [Corynebacterium genitalium ATCC 33030]|uniref:beta-N-acetylhexosaminidase n=1 Tax=Corynebacterium genitalium ATCC 33030 TaxID=585529 RepID=D7W9K3_9CORY|nr:glycoside hydrolase family 3 N-terminal domain-containing protein [Corynebacterium genitalium]EFK55483.1 glycosyl hydrolase family 3 N-terminal domain protein [Corynebacterium genitalium ATCC 33030]UUA89282.1 glycoside hydrolase family 3 protein [Corynebacterium genitalium ATCC 33030]